MTWYLLSKDSSPHFDVISDHIGYIIKMLEDFTCGSCLSELLDETYNNIPEKDKLYLLLGTICGAEFSVYENKNRESLIKEWLLLEGEL